MDEKEALRTFGTGENFHAQHYFGFHKTEEDGRAGYVFRVWAPNAENVQLIGDFTAWFDAPLQMTKNEAGVWKSLRISPRKVRFINTW